MKRMISIIALMFSAAILSACSSSGKANISQVTKFSDIETQEWQYVALGFVDEGWYPEILAEKIEQDQNVNIRLFYWQAYNPRELLADIRTDATLRDALSNAELITFYTSLEFVFTYDYSRCAGEDHQDCLREELEIYRQNVEDLVSELVSLIDLDSTIVLAHTSWPFFTDPIGTERFDVLNEYYQAANSHLISVCEDYGIPVARVYEAFMGADGSKNPEDDGLVEVVWASYLPTPAGNEIIANLIFELGN